jgi:hypothetical protein
MVQDSIRSAVYKTFCLLHNCFVKIHLNVTLAGTTLEANSVPARIVLFLLFTAVIFLYTAYSACIVALLQSSTDSIRTLKDLLDSGLTLGVEDVVYNRHYFPVCYRQPFL